MSAPVALYRQFSEQGRLLYVGITACPAKRAGEHAMSSGWRRQIANITVTWFPSREAALIAEREAIRTERPLYSVGEGHQRSTYPTKRGSGADNSALVRRIERRLAETGESETAFGRRAVGDLSFVQRLRAGTNIRQATKRKALAALAERAAA